MIILKYYFFKGFTSVFIFIIIHNSISISHLLYTTINNYNMNTDILLSILQKTRINSQEIFLNVLIKFFDIEENDNIKTFSIELFKYIIIQTEKIYKYGGIARDIIYYFTPFVSITFSKTGNKEEKKENRRKTIRFIKSLNRRIIIETISEIVHQFLRYDTDRNIRLTIAAFEDTIIKEKSFIDNKILQWMFHKFITLIRESGNNTLKYNHSNTELPLKIWIPSGNNNNDDDDLRILLVRDFFYNNYFPKEIKINEEMSYFSIMKRSNDEIAIIYFKGSEFGINFNGKIFYTILAIVGNFNLFNNEKDNTYKRKPYCIVYPLETSFKREFWGSEEEFLDLLIKDIRHYDKIINQILFKNDNKITASPLITSQWIWKESRPIPYNYPYLYGSSKRISKKEEEEEEENI